MVFYHKIIFILNTQKRRKAKLFRCLLNGNILLLFSFFLSVKTQYSKHTGRAYQ